MVINALASLAIPDRAGSNRTIPRSLAKSTQRAIAPTADQASRSTKLFNPDRRVESCDQTRSGGGDV